MLKIKLFMLALSIFLTGGAISAAAELSDCSEGASAEAQPDQPFNFGDEKFAFTTHTRVYKDSIFFVSFSCVYNESKSFLIQDLNVEWLGPPLSNTVPQGKAQGAWSRSPTNNFILSDSCLYFGWHREKSTHAPYYKKAAPVVDDKNSCANLDTASENSAPDKSNIFEVVKGFFYRTSSPYFIELEPGNQNSLIIFNVENTWSYLEYIGLSNQVALSIEHYKGRSGGNIEGCTAYIDNNSLQIYENTIIKLENEDRNAQNPLPGHHFETFFLKSDFDGLLLKSQEEQQVASDQDRIKPLAINIQTVPKLTRNQANAAQIAKELHLKPVNTRANVVLRDAHIYLKNDSGKLIASIPIQYIWRPENDRK